MKTKIYIFNIILIIIFQSINLFCQQKRIQARKYFDRQQSVIIDVEEPDILFFDDTQEYILYGKKLTIFADIVEFRGNIVIRSFPKDSKGCPCGWCAYG